MIEIFILGQRYEVPDSLTILGALEYAGFRLKRGVGCRGGFCGACSTVFRFKGNYELHYALSCQTVVQPNMVLAQIPFFPARRADYHLEQLSADIETLHEQYPEILHCFGCNTCTKACPQELDVMGYMSAAIRGDIEELAEKSFDCIMCGLCTARCPAELSPPYVALLARRLYGKYLASPAPQLHRRIKEINKGVFINEIQELKSLSLDELKRRYEEREIEA